MKKTILITLLIFSFSSFGTAILDKNKNIGLKITDIGFRDACSMGLIEGCKIVRKFGVNENLTLGVERDIWDFGSADFGNLDYTWPSDGTAPIDSVSSSSLTDTQPITIFGLDINGNEVEQQIQLAGQTRVALTTPLWRVFRIVNNQASTNNTRHDGFVGNVYVFENVALTAGVPSDLTKVRAFVFDGNNQTQMSQYTVPKGHTAYFLGLSTRLATNKAANVIYKAWARGFGGVFRRIDNGVLQTTGSSSFGAIVPVMVAFSEKTDFVISAVSDQSDAGIAILYNLIILKDSVFK